MTGTVSSSAAPGSAGVLRAADRAFLVAGLGLLIFLVYDLGPAAVFANLVLVGWGIVPVIAQEIGAYVCNTLGWRAAFPPPGPAIRFRQLLAARIAGDAVNYLTPTATLGGEFVRSRYVGSRTAGTGVAASVAVAKLSQGVGQIAFILAGLAIVAQDAGLPHGVLKTLFAGLAAFTLVLAGGLLLQRRGMFAPAFRLAQRLGIARRATTLRARLERLDCEIRRIHGAHAGTLARSSAWFAAGWAMGVVEVYLILWLLDVPVSVHRALTIEVLSAAVDGMLFFVPLKAGTQEGGKVLIFTLLGLDPAKGLTLGIVRRIRELTWAGVGMALLSREQRQAASHDTEPQVVPAVPGEGAPAPWEPRWP